MEFLTPDILLAVGALIAVGVITTFVSGLIGTGGGFIIIPVFHFAFMQAGLGSNDAMLMAVGTTMPVMIITTIWLMYLYHSADNTDWRVVRTWTPVLLLGVLAAWALGLTTNPTVIKLTYAVVVTLFGLKMLFVREGRIVVTHLARWVWYVSGFVIGFLCVLVGTGGSSFTIPVMNVFGTPTKKAIGTAPALSLGVGLLGIGAYLIAPTIDLPFTTGNVNWLVVVAVLPGAFYAGKLGVALQQRMDMNVLRRIFGVMLIIVGIRFIWLAVA